MDLLQTIALSAGLAWASGLRLYLVVFLAGVLGHFGYLQLPSTLAVLQHPVGAVVRLHDDIGGQINPEFWGVARQQREVEKFAQARYNQSGSERVLEKIEKMDDRKAKEYLKRLIKDNMNVGIEIISEGGKE